MKLHGIELAEKVTLPANHVFIISQTTQPTVQDMVDYLANFSTMFDTTNISTALGSPNFLWWDTSVPATTTTTPAPTTTTTPAPTTTTTPAPTTTTTAAPTTTTTPAGTTTTPAPTTTTTPAPTTTTTPAPTTTTTAAPTTTTTTAAPTSPAGTEGFENMTSIGDNGDWGFAVTKYAGTGSLSVDTTYQRTGSKCLRVETNYYDFETDVQIQFTNFTASAGSLTLYYRKGFSATDKIIIRVRKGTSSTDLAVTGQLDPQTSYQSVTIPSIPAYNNENLVLVIDRGTGAQEYVDVALDDFTWTDD